MSIINLYMFRAVLLLIIRRYYFVYKKLVYTGQANSRLTAHHQEILLCIYSNWYIQGRLIAGLLLIIRRYYSVYTATGIYRAGKKKAYCLSSGGTTLYIQ